MFALANIELRAKTGMGISCSTAGQQARGPRPAADERKPLFTLANDELRVICAWREERDFKARSEATQRESERWRAPPALSAIHYHCYMHWKLRYGTLLMIPQAKLSYGCVR